jgi:hypothetical protein
MLLEPSLHEAARRLGHVEETNSGAAARVLPRNLARQADQLGLTGKCELEINLACGRKAAGAADQSSAVAEVGQNRVAFGGSGIGDVDVGTNGRARSSAFAAHEAAGGAQTDAGALGRKRTIENKVGAEAEHGAGVETAVHNGNEHAGAVFGGLTQARKKLLGTLVGAIVEDNGVEALALEQLQSAGDRGGMLDRHPQFGQDEREQAGGVLIRAHHEGA